MIAFDIPDGNLGYEESFLEKSEADSILEILKEELSLKQNDIVIFGKNYNIILF